MSEVNESVYPIGTTNLHGIKVCEYALDHYLDGNTWENSIAISQSTSSNAPFNKITHFVPYDNDLKLVERTYNFQQIGLFYTGGYSFGNSNQYTSRNYASGINNSDTNSYFYLRTLGKTQRGASGSWIQNLQTNTYHPNNYGIVTGLNLQNVLGVICVAIQGSGGNTYWCSLKYYNDHKNDTSSPAYNGHVSAVFMQVYYGHPANTNPDAIRMLSPITLTGQSLAEWRINQNQLEYNPLDNWYSGFPCSVFQGMVSLESADRMFRQDYTGYASIIWPLVGCMIGMQYNGVNSAQSWSSVKTQAGTIIGGVKDVDYSLSVDWSSTAPTNANVYVIISEAGLSRAFSTAATYGIPFSDDFPDSPTTLFTSDNTTYIPVANDGGYFDGQFETLTVEGEETQYAKDDPIWNGGTDAAWNNRTYDPDIPIPVDNINLNVPTITPMNIFNKTYILNQDKVKAFANFLFRTMVDDSSFWKTVLVKSLELYGGGINAVTSLKMYPFDVRAAVSASNTGVVVIGACPVKDNDDNLLNGYILPDNANVVLNLGSFKIFKKYNNFLDYGPYTSISLYIPYVGSVNLDPSIYMDHTVSVKMIVDLTTGICTAVVYSDNNMITYHKGVIGVDVPINSVNANNMERTMAGNALSAASIGFGIAGAALGAPMAVVSGMAALTAKTGQEIGSYDSVPMNNGGQASPGCGLYLPNYCYITIARPKVALKNSDEEYIYNRWKGYAMNKPTMLISYITSFEDSSNVRVQGELSSNYVPLGNLTPEEIQRVIQLFRDGVTFTSF